MIQKILRLLLFVGSFWVLWNLVFSTIDIWKRQDILKERQAELKDAQDKNFNLKRRLEEVHSGEYIEKVARDDLGLVKPGETLIIVSSSTEASSSAQTLPEIEIAGPGWASWRKLFF